MKAFRNRLSVCASSALTWKKLYENLLQKLNQQASGLLFIFSEFTSLHNVLHLCIHLENRGWTVFEYIVKMYTTEKASLAAARGCEAPYTQLNFPSFYCKPSLA